MEYILFPEESSQLAAMEMHLPQADFPDVLASMEKLSQKADGVAQAAFTAAIDRMEALANRDVAISHQICAYHEMLNNLSITKDRLPPQDVAEKLDELREKIFSCGQPVSPNLQGQLNALEAQWRHQEFLYTFPLAEELNPDSFQSNLFHQLKNDPQKLKQLQAYEKLCTAAEAVYGGDRNAFSKLSRKTKLAVEQKLFERFPGEKVDLYQCDSKLLAAALMDVLADQMFQE